MHNGCNFPSSDPWILAKTAHLISIHIWIRIVIVVYQPALDWIYLWKKSRASVWRVVLPMQPLSLSKDGEKRVKERAFYSHISLFNQNCEQVRWIKNFYMFRLNQSDKLVGKIQKPWGGALREATSFSDRFSSMLMIEMQKVRGCFMNLWMLTTMELVKLVWQGIAAGREMEKSQCGGGCRRCHRGAG